MKDKGNTEGVTPEIRGKLQQFTRVLMSYIDFQQAGEIAGYILEHSLHDRLPQDRFLLQGLNTGMIVAYCRPFSNNERGGDTTVPRLPKRFTDVLTKDDLRLHDEVREDRNTVLAHSDSAPWDMRPRIVRLGDFRDVLLPLHNDVHAPITRDATEQFGNMCGKLMEACFEERTRLEPELSPYLEVVEINDEELERAKELVMPRSDCKSEV
jgi:hypothetical protein